jgi:hypothetical protein
VIVGINSTDEKASRGIGETIPRGNLTRVGCGSGSTLTGRNLALAGFWRGRALAGALDSSRNSGNGVVALVEVTRDRRWWFTVTGLGQ